MLIAKFLAWSEGADAEARAEAAGALAGAYLYGDLDAIDGGDALRLLTLLLDDPSPLVRRVLAEAFASAVDAPHHILAALAADRSDIAAIVLERSTALSDAELIDAVAIGGEASQRAVARRPRVSAALAGAIAEVAGFGAVLVLSRNAGAELSAFAVGRMIDRFGEAGELRETLARREDLGPEMRHALVLATAEALGGFVRRCGWMAPERTARVLAEACDRAAVRIASTDLETGTARRRFVAHLRSRGALTPALVLRALLSGDLALFEAVLSESSGQSETRVAAFVRNPEGLGFAGAYRASGLPDGLMTAFQAALSALAAKDGAGPARAPRLDPRVVARVIDACAARGGEELARLTALLRRFQAEAARDAARAELGPLPAAHRGAIALRERQDPPRLPTGARRAAA